MTQWRVSSKASTTSAWTRRCARARSMAWALCLKLRACSVSAVQVSGSRTNSPVLRSRNSTRMLMSAPWEGQGFRAVESYSRRSAKRRPNRFCKRTGGVQALKRKRSCQEPGQRHASSRSGRVKARRNYGFISTAFSQAVHNGKSTAICLCYQRKRTRRGRSGCGPRLGVTAHFWGTKRRRGPFEAYRRGPKEKGATACFSANGRAAGFEMLSRLCITPTLMRNWTTTAGSYSSLGKLPGGVNYH